MRCGVTNNRYRAGLTRRNLLEMLAGATALSAPMMGQKTTPADPPQRRTLDTSSSPPVLWQLPLSTSGSIQNSCYSNGLIGALVKDTSAAASEQYRFFMIEIQGATEAETENYSTFQFPFQYLMPWSGGFFAVDTNQQMWICRRQTTSTGSSQTVKLPVSAAGGGAPPMPATKPIVSHNKIYYVAQDKSLCALVLDLVASPTAPFYIAGVVSTPINYKISIGFDEVFLNLTGSTLTIVADSNLASVDISGPRPAVNWVAAGPERPVQALITGNSIFVLQAASSPAGALGSISQFDLSGNPITAAGLAGIVRTPGNMVLDAGSILFADSSGKLWSYNAVTLKSEWDVQINGDLSLGTLYSENGIAYVGDDSGNMTAVDRSSAGRDAVSYAAHFGYPLLGVENGVCYLFERTSTGASVATAVDVAQTVHGFSCDTVLMPDHYVAPTSTGDPTPAKASYRAVLTLLDECNTPRRNTPIRVWAEDDCTITDDTVTVAIGTDSGTWFNTDGAGQLSLAVTAEGPYAPALHLWAGFMLQEESLVVYLDGDTINSLTEKQGSDYGSATSYSGCAVLASTQSSGNCGTVQPGNADAIASTVRNALGGGASKASLEATSRRNAASAKRFYEKRASAGKAMNRRARLALESGSNSYIQYPGTNQSLAHITPGVPVTRVFDPGSSINFTATIDATTGQVSFGPNVSAADLAMAQQASRRFVMARAMGREAAELALTSSLLSALKQAISSGKDVIRKIATVVDHAAKTVTHTIETALNAAIQIVVSAVEDAITIVSLFLQSIVHDVVKIAEWLSKVFDFDGIRKTQAQIKNQVVIRTGSLSKWVARHANSNNSAISQAFDDAKNTIQQTIQSAISKYEGQSMQSQQYKGNDPSAVYNYGGARSQAQTSMLTSKLRANAGGATMTAQVAISSSTPATFETEFVEWMNHTLIPALDLPKLKADIESVFSDLKLLMSSPGQLLQKSLADVLKLLGDVAVTLLEAVQALITGIMSKLAAFVGDIVTWLQEGIEIPVISDLFRWIFKADLTLLDLCSFLVAVPATLISKAAGIPIPNVAAKTLASGGYGDASGPGLFDFAACLAGVLAAFTDAAADTADEKSATLLGSLDLGMDTLAQLISLPGDLETNDTAIYASYGFSFLPNIFTFAGIVLGNASTEEGSLASKTLSYGLPLLYCGYGVASLLATIHYNHSDPAHFDDLATYSAGFVSLDFIFKLALFGGSDSAIVAAVADVVFGTTASILTFADTLNG